MKKRLAACMTAACLAATAVGASVALTGCGGGGDKFPTKDSDPTASLKVFLLANANEQLFYNEYFAKKAADYNAANGTNIKIDFTGVENDDYYTQLDALNGMGESSMPDIFYVRPNEILQYKEKIFCLEQFKDTVADNENLNLNLSNIYPLALNLYKYNDKTNQMDEANGELYAFPKDLSTQQLGYNKTLVQNSTSEIHAAGLPLPWELGEGTYANKLTYTWDEYHTMCEIVADAGAAAGTKYYASDVPGIEILTKSYGGDILNTQTMKVDVTSSAVTQAINYQKKLVTARDGHQPAADSAGATQEHFKGGTVAFYGQVGSWEVHDYDQALGAGNWNVMPWPTVKEGDNWKGVIMSAGYVVSNKCKNWQFAMELAASFMTYSVQDTMVREKKISIPLDMRLRSDYEKEENDNVYSPSSKGRKVFLDVISGTHGFRPAEYYTFTDGWIKPLNDELGKMWKGQSYTIGAATQSNMQAILDGYKNLY